MSPGTDIANPTARERGTIASWTDPNGDGRIRADNGDILYAKFSSLLVEQLPRPGVKQRVEFSRLRRHGDPRVFAIGVMVLDSKDRPAISVSDESHDKRY